MMRVLPPADIEEQFNIYVMEDYVPELTDEVTGEAFPATSYRIRWNERTASWECDWFDQDGNPIDQGRRLSIDWWIRTPWGNGTDPDPMPAHLMFVSIGTETSEADFETFGRSHLIVEWNREEIEEFKAAAGSALPAGYTTTVP